MKYITKISMIILFTLEITFAEDDFIVDYEMAGECIGWLEYINTGADTMKIKEYFMEKVAPTEGCKTIIAHWERFREWDNEIFYEFIAEALGLIKSGKNEFDENGGLTRFGERKKLWNEALNNTAGLRRDLMSLKNMDLSKRSAEIAKEYLPEEADLENDFYVVLFGASTAFSVGDRNGFDLLQMPRNKNGEIAAENVLLTFAHELHHTGFSSTAGKNMGDIQNENQIILVGILTAEGMATYFINKPFEKIEKYKNLSQAIYHEVATDWEEHLKNTKSYYNQAAEDLRKSLNGDIDEKNIYQYWLDGAVGKAYALGVDMFAVIEKYLGKDAAVNIAKDYRQMLNVYNSAAEIGISQGEDLFLFDEELVEAVLNTE